MTKYALSLLAVTALSYAQEATLDTNATVETAPTAPVAQALRIDEAPKGPQFLAKYNVYQGALGVQNGELEYKLTPKLTVAPYLGIGTVKYGSYSYDYGYFSAGARAYYYTNGAFQTGNYIALRASYDSLSATSGSTTVTGSGLTYGFVGGYLYNLEIVTVSFEAGYTLGSYTFTSTTSTSKYELAAAGFIIGASIGIPF